MPYIAHEMREIERDPVRLRAYYWRVATNMRRMAKQNRRQSRATGVAHPVTNYRPAFEEGRDLEHWARTLDAVADQIIDNIDALVRTTQVLDPGQ